MSPAPPLPPEILPALARGAALLTANQRAARTLRHAYDLHQAALGLSQWHPPAVLAWESWLADLWHRLLLDGHDGRLLLNPTQEHALWRAVLASDRTLAASPSLRPIDSLAQLAADAFALLHGYRARPRLAAAADTADTRAFARWAAEFDRRCARTGCLTQAQLPETLRVAIVDGHLASALPAEAVLVGFDRQTPAQSALLEALEFAGTTLTQLPTRSPAANVILAPAADAQAEMEAAARWLRTGLTADPHARFAVIVPALEPVRAALDRTFRRILAPELDDIAAPAHTGPYEFSLGVPLAHTPLAAAALEILRWAASPLPLESITALLLSPHFATPRGETQPSSTDPTEHLTRAEFDAFALRRHSLLEPQLTLEDFYRLAAGSRHSTHIPTLLHRLRLLRKLDLPTEGRTHAQWAAHFQDILHAAAWPAPHLDSTEFQTLAKWNAALDDLTTLDLDGTRIPFAAALEELRRICTRTLFAPETRHAPIQIMGPLESAGSTFDAVWFLHAGDLTWPTSASPNPLIPHRLQVELAMPGAGPAAETLLARKITARIAASAPTAVFSYALQAPDGHQRPSPTLAAFPFDTVPADDLAPPTPFPGPIALEAFADTGPIPAPPGGVLQGGASLLADQAACAFRAFAERRLFSSAPESAALGLDARERGSLVHKVLERFWAEVETQSALKALPRPQRDRILAQCIDEALREGAPEATGTWPAAYLATERQRLLNLLNPWLDFELTRPPFAVLSREEKLSNVQIGPLHLDIRVDRVDEAILDGEPAGHIILDYKTGSARRAEWLGPRPDAPQLPLYAVVAGSPNLAAVAFAGIRPGKLLSLEGFQAQPGILPKAPRGNPGSLDAQVEAWRTVLTCLAEEFYAGAAHVAPKEYPTTCRYCRQRLLCRLDPSTLEPDTLEDLLDEENEQAPAEATARG